MAKLLAYDTLEFSEKIKTPNLTNLMDMEFIYNASYDDVMKYGHFSLRSLLRKAPIKGSKQNILVRSNLRFIKPFHCPISTNSWHLDGSTTQPFYSNDITHIYIGSGSNLLTQFLGNEVVIVEKVANMDHVEQMDYFHNSSSLFNMVTRSIETERFVTFTSRHPHKVDNAVNSHIRYFLEVVESDYQESVSWESSLQEQSYVYRGIRKQEIMSIRRTSSGIELINY
jgi:hypothetical protein